ncbi:MAG: hypothetical protein JXA58_05980 [Dehalococcoidia bacterium]|nr:hypothetical protein [Dehalococcoidia bacterium]
MLKVANSVADLDSAELIDTPHVAKALQYRKREGDQSAEASRPRDYAHGRDESNVFETLTLAITSSEALCVRPLRPSSNSACHRSPSRRSKPFLSLRLQPSHSLQPVALVLHRM